MPTTPVDVSRLIRLDHITSMIGSLRISKGGSVVYTIQNVDKIPDLERIPEVVSRLETIQKDVVEKFGEHDGLGSFNYLYTVITKSVQADVEKEVAAGGFQDRAFITRLDVEFANRYFRAIDAEGTAAMPAPWDVLIKNRGRQHISALMFAVVGVSAHVNFDLPFALVETCKDHGGLIDGTRHADYQHINDVFAREMKQLRSHFEGAFLQEFDTSYVSKVENLISDAVVVWSRNHAWNEALKDLWPEREDPHAQAMLEAHAASWVGRINGGLLTADDQLGHAAEMFEWTSRFAGRLAKAAPVHL